MKVITIGRSWRNDIVIEDPLVSRHHLQIIEEDSGQYLIQDMGSRNGTFVNGNLISNPSKLAKSDIIRIGNTILPWLNYFTSTIDNEAQGTNTEPLLEKERSKTFFEKLTKVFK